MSVVSEAIKSMLRGFAETKGVNKVQNVSFQNEDGTFKSTEQILEEVAYIMKEKGGSNNG